MKTETRFWPWFAIGIPAIILAGLLAIWSQDRAHRLQTDQELSLSTKVALAAIDTGMLERLTVSAADLNSPDYLFLREQLANIDSIFKAGGLRGLYVMRIDGKEVRFMVDSASVDDPWHSEPGTVYENVSQSVYDTFRDGKRRLVGPETDEYGTFFSSLDLIAGTGGAAKMVVGADIEASAYARALNAKRMPIAAATLLLAMLYAAILLIVKYRLQQQRYAASYTNRLEILIEQMPVGVLIFEGSNAFLTMANAAALKMLGKNKTDFRPAARFSETFGLVRKDGTPYPSQELPVSVTLATGRASQADDIFIGSDGASKTAIRMSSVTIDAGHGREKVVAAVLEDFTKEYELDRQKDEFVSIASHELKAPLTGIKWNVRLLLDKSEGRLNASQRSYAESIDEINEQLVGLVGELLNVSRLESGKIDVHPEATDVNEMIEGVLKELSGLVERKRLKLEHDRKPLPEMEIDHRLIREVFMNLLSNAVKYTPEGGRITLSADVREGEVIFSVSDSGIGIPKAQQQQMFRKFFRASNASEAKIEGTGLGLYISKQAVELSGGEIGLDSEEGVGSTFWFRLPISGGIRKDGGKTLS